MVLAVFAGSLVALAASVAPQVPAPAAGALPGPNIVNGAKDWHRGPKSCDNGSGSVGLKSDDLRKDGYVIGSGAGSVTAIFAFVYLPGNNTTVKVDTKMTGITDPPGAYSEGHDIDPLLFFGDTDPAGGPAAQLPHPSLPGAGLGFNGSISATATGQVVQWGGPALQAGWYRFQINVWAYGWHDPLAVEAVLTYSSNQPCDKDKQEIACLCNPASGLVASGTATKDDPISTGYGNSIESATDIDVPSRSGALNVSRTYNSLASSVESPLGWGWNWNLGAKIVFDQPYAGDARVIQGSGAPVTFSPLVSSGTTVTYEGGPWTTATLVRQSDGTFQFRLKDGTVYTFAARSGSTSRLTGITTIDGAQAAIAYNADGTLKDVTDLASTRKLTFGWNAAKNRVTSVTDQASPTPRTVGYHYDANNDLDLITDVAGNKHGYGYQTQTIGGSTYHLLTKVRAPKQANPATPDTAHDLVNAYDTDGRVTTQTDNRISPARVTTFNYAAAGYPAQSPTMPNGATVITVKPAGGAVVYTRADFYTTGQRTRVEVGTGSEQSVHRFTYDTTTGGVATVDVRTSAFGVTPETWTAQSSATYDLQGNLLTAKADPNGLNRVTTMTYNDLGLPLTVRDPAGVVTTNTYTNGHLTYTCVPINATPPAAGGSMDCDTAGVTKSTKTAGYDTNGDMLWTRDADHQTGAQDQTNSTRFSYNAATGYLESVTQPVTPESQIRTPAINSGNRTTIAYDNVGRLLSTTSPKGNRTGATASDYTTTYTPVTAYGDPTTVADQLGGIAKKHFDENHNVDWSQPADGNCTSVPTVKCTTYQYDLADRLISTNRPEPGTSQTTAWTVDSKLQSQTDAMAGSTVYTYDSAGRPKMTTDPTPRSTIYGYDLYGRLASVTQPGSGSNCGPGTKINCIQYTYDNASELTNITYSDPTTASVGPMTYDAAGRRLTAPQAGGGGLTYEWDTAGRMTKSVSGTPALGFETVSYGWDPADNMTTITYPGPGATCTAPTKVLCVQRGFDAANRLSSITDFLGRVTSYNLDDNSNYKQTNYPTTAPTTDTFNFDRADRLTSTTGPATPAITFGTSTAGNLTVDYTRQATGMLGSETSNGIAAPGGGTGSTPTNYGYDADNRLCYYAATAGTNPTCAAPPSGAKTYTYDGADNMTKNGAGTQFKSDPANQLCYSVFGSAAAACTSAPASATNYGKDARGNRTNSTPPVAGALPSTYTYDQANRMTQATVPAQWGNQGEYSPLTTPARIMDTRAGLGPCPNGVCGKILAGSTVTLTVAGAGGLPASGIAAVVVELGATQGTGNGYLTVWSPDSTRPGTSNLNYAAGQTITNSAVIKTGTGANDGKINIYNAGPGDVDVIIDAHGSYSTWTGTAGGTFNPVDPVRLTSTPVTIAANSTQDVTVAGVGGLPATGISALTANLTVTNSTADGKITAYSTGLASPPGTTNVTFATGQTIASMSIVKLGTDGKIRIANVSTGTVQVYVDAFGWTSTTATSGQSDFAPVDPTRIPSQAVAANATQSIQISGVGGVPASATAVSVNITVTGVTGNGFLSAWPTGGTNGSTSILNYGTGQTISNAAIIKLGSGANAGKINVKANVAGVNVIVDINGYFNSDVNVHQYTYDSDGMRLSHTATGFGTTAFTYSRVGGIPNILATKFNGTYSYVIYGPDGLPMEEASGLYVAYLHHDQIGSTRLVTNLNGSPLATYSYDPYGNLAASTGNVNQTSFLYSGQYRDGETGFYYLRARLFDPATGQFITRDPAAANTRLPYGYTYGDPLNHTDRNGLWPWDGTCIAIGDNGCDNSATQQWSGNVLAGAGNTLTFGHGVDIAAQATGQGDNFTATHADTCSWAYHGGQIGGAALGAVFLGDGAYSLYEAGSAEGALTGDAGMAQWEPPWSSGGGGSGILSYVAPLLVLGGAGYIAWKFWGEQKWNELQRSKNQLPVFNPPTTPPTTR